MGADPAPHGTSQDSNRSLRGPFWTDRLCLEPKILNFGQGPGVELWNCY